MTLMSGIAHSTTFSAQRTQQIAAVINNSHTSQKPGLDPKPRNELPKRAIQVAGARSRFPRAPSRGGVLIRDGHVPDAANERRLVSVDGARGPNLWRLP